MQKIGNNKSIEDIQRRHLANLSERAGLV